MNRLADAKCAADIDITFDFRSDTPKDRDPDTHEQNPAPAITSCFGANALPGEACSLSCDDTTRGSYLHHRSAIGEFSLSSDAVIPTFKWVPHIKTSIPKAELDAFNAIGYTIGGMMVFPGNRIDRKWTIKQARGCTKRIGDQFDLTLEYIRRHYSAVWSPLADVLARYAHFFNLFRHFRGYVEFFLLAGSCFRRFLCGEKSHEPFDDFRRSPIPASVHANTTRTRAPRSHLSRRVTT